MFKYSLDNKRYHTLNYYFKYRYGKNSPNRRTSLALVWSADATATDHCVPAADRFLDARISRFSSMTQNFPGAVNPVPGENSAHVHGF